MQRREFIKHSGLLLAVAVIGLPGFDLTPEAEAVTTASHSSEFRLYGHKRDGCAHDPANMDIRRISDALY